MPYETAPSYISFEGDVAWEAEHGLQLIFNHGLSIGKVGPYSEHHTNASARANPDLVDVVFLA